MMEVVGSDPPKTDLLCSEGEFPSESDGILMSEPPDDIICVLQDDDDDDDDGGGGGGGVWAFCLGFHHHCGSFQSFYTAD